MVLVTGTVKAHGYSNRDGQIAASLEVTADQVKFLSGSGGDAQAAEAQSGGAPGEEDIPF